MPTERELLSEIVGPGLLLGDGSPRLHYRPQPAAQKPPPTQKPGSLEALAAERGRPPPRTYGEAGALLEEVERERRAAEKAKRSGAKLAEEFDRQLRERVKGGR